MTHPPPAGSRRRARAARRGVDRRRRRRGRSAGGGRGQRRRRPARGGARRAARRLVERLRLRRHEARAVPRVGRAVARSARTAARSCTARRAAGERGVDRPHVVALRLDVEATSSARCCGSEPSATRSRSSTTSAAARPTSGTSPRRRSAVLELPYGDVPRRRGGRVHAGRTSPRRSSRRRACRPAFGGSRPPSSARERRGPRIRCCAARRGAPELPHWREGLRACLESATLSRHACAGHRRRRLHRLAVRPAARRRRATRSSFSTS